MEVDIHGLHQLINVPSMLGADGYRIRDPIQQIQLLDADGVNLVEDIDDGNVTPGLCLDDVDEVVNCRIASDGNIGGRHLVFVHHGLDLVMVCWRCQCNFVSTEERSGLTDMGQGDCMCDVETTLILLPDRDVWRLLVDSDTEPFEFVLNHPLVGKRLVDIENDEYQVTGLRDGNDLSPPSSSIFGALDDTRQIDDL